MSESVLSFHIPKELIALNIKEDLCRNQELKELGDLSPHWDNLRKNVLTHCDQMVTMYQDILTELSKETGSSFKSSSSKGEKTLEFVPINLHLQRMQVHGPHLKDALYDVITVGAPAAHFQGFKNGGLRKLLHRFETERRNTGYQFIYYSPENTAKAKEVLSHISQLQPLIATHADLLLSSASQRSPDSLRSSLKMLSEKTELFVHAFKDQLVRSALLALFTARPGGILKKPPSPKDSKEDTCPLDEPPQLRRQDSIPHHSDYDEEEWDRVWANVGKSLNCIIATVDKLIERDGHNGGGPRGSSGQDGDTEPSLEDSITSHPKEDWYEQLQPLILTLKECMGEVVSRAKQSLTFVLLQELAYSLPQCLMLTLRRDIVFSQALAGLVCGFIIKLHTSLHDPDFLQQLHTVGLIAQYEGLISTYSDEIGMLEDMAVGISDLRKVAFKITEAKSSDDLPILTGRRREHYVVEVRLPAAMFESLPLQIKEGQLLHVYPVLFNIGINEQQTLAERFGDVSLQESINQENFELVQEYYSIFTEKMPPDYISHFQEQNDLKGLLDNLHQNIQAKKRKNVEIMWLAATICRKLNGIRFTCCKSAKDRTSMSVTLEQCSILRDEHQLHKDFFIRALDCMRRWLNKAYHPVKLTSVTLAPMEDHSPPTATDVTSRPPPFLLLTCVKVVSGLQETGVSEQSPEPEWGIRMAWLPAPLGRCIGPYTHVGKSEKKASAGHRILELPGALAALACVFLMSSEADFFYLSIYHGSTNPFSCTQVSLFGCYYDLDHSSQIQGALSESDDPETGRLTDDKPTSRHFYPVALLLVSSHLLVVWLILSLALLLAKYQ
ncbi:Type II inositol 3,4-bisphosphate 4-phosphatase [Microtus ochrogaster]|uniref:Type II inositol 3,4-bisphosphate 4-phosphatase n=1 Tax=Microtus ochrogaster TaxID=79684 RepID=A0A8J6KTH2_MICOH|nr:Type II inositol 3,4-bisphosphate 4-phosphatase [Microtus ochrogaster]